MATHRLFVALDLPAAIRQAAIDTQHTLRSTWPELRFTRPENLHLTLKFLGEIPTAQRDRLEAPLESIECTGLPTRIASAGVFSPRIAWLALQGADGLQKQVDAALEGFFPAEHRFMGHITIARTRRMSTALRRFVETLEVPAVEATAESFSLVESHLGPSGPRYETLARFPLA